MDPRNPSKDVGDQWTREKWHKTSCCLTLSDHISHVLQEVTDLPRITVIARTQTHDRVYTDLGYSMSKLLQSAAPLVCDPPLKVRQCMHVVTAIFGTTVLPSTVVSPYTYINKNRSQPLYISVYIDNACWFFPLWDTKIHAWFHHFWLTIKISSMDSKLQVGNDQDAEQEL